ncbi:hypothetical protein [Peribacillus frigoritolerans]|uniref:hypothetical protein n=1 Tax=Peribacillus frigoritolerans TaxID=450367 RepID=UPI003B8D0E46
MGKHDEDSNKETVDLYISEFKKMFLLGKALAKSKLKPNSFTDPFEHFSIEFKQEHYLKVGYYAKQRILLSEVDEIKSVKLSGGRKIKAILPYILICENCQRKLDTDRLKWCYFIRTPLNYDTNDYIEESEINEIEVYALRYGSLFKRLCYDCMYDYLEDNALLEEYFKPIYYIEDIEPSFLEDYEGQWVELKNITIDSFT